MPIDFLAADWPAPGPIHAATTLRSGGASRGPFASMNLGDHVGDDAEAVLHNRALLAQGLPSAPNWLTQVHGCDIVAAEIATAGPADAAFSALPGRVCAVLTADCLPVLFCDRAGQQVAAAHAGWRGLADGILERCVARFACPPAQLLAWLGPAIGPQAFEVGPEVRERFCDHDHRAQGAFVRTERDRYLADLYQLARLRLAAAGVDAVYGGGLCTYSDSDRFFSYRRDGVTGRMASVIWIEDVR